MSQYKSQYKEEEGNGGPTGASEASEASGMNDGAGGSDGRSGEAMIRLDNITKTFPGSDEPAVHELSLDVQEGEIVVFVGPSGCGKTTTMKMINRIIEPTGGRIFLMGEDVTDQDADQLRRRIGYVIQQIGLFPHMTIADNIATVPKMLGWDKQRISERTDELLEMVGIDPKRFKGRYPKELSGGQMQRVGVARSMAADPPVMLMDEPFGAIDPITRERLQDEFLRLQETLKKTIVFVTHDIDEAIKMGDRIVILKEGALIAQYDTPEVILTDPADDFVEDFIGSGATIKRLSLSTVKDIEPTDWPVIGPSTGGEEALRTIQDSGREYALMLDEEKRPQRWIPAEDLKNDGRDLSEMGRPAVAIVKDDANLYDTLDAMITSYKGSAVVVDDDGAYTGVVDFDTVLEAIGEMRPGQQGAVDQSPSGQAADQQVTS
ncbi:ABC transporter ATP-binding protein [Rubrobacter aplysinae]|uniref:ABC transporter ATP-binding protein n=1 Tax=Rubrobacter aplysinae TaxID=909625 RepID=UPI000B04B0BD